VYEYRNSEEREWAALYSFGEYEFFVSDFEAINFGVSNDGASFQTFTVIGVKFLLAKWDGDEGEDEGEGSGNNAAEKEMVIGKVMLKDGVLKKNR